MVAMVLIVKTRDFDQFGWQLSPNESGTTKSKKP